jgi:hypothetical protein
MLTNKYESLVTELNSFIIKHNELKIIQLDADFDLRWRLTELFKEVDEKDEQKFIDLSGMKGQLMTTAQKKELIKHEQELSKNQKKKSNSLSELTQVKKIRQIKFGQSHYIEEQLDDVTQILLK